MKNNQFNRYNPYEFQRHVWGKYYKQDLDFSDVVIKIEIKDDNNCYFISSQKNKGPTLMKGPCSGTGSMGLINHPAQELKENQDNLGKVQVIIRGQEHGKFDDIDSYWTFVKK